MALEMFYKGAFYRKRRFANFARIWALTGVSTDVCSEGTF